MEHLAKSMENYVINQVYIPFLLYPWMYQFEIANVFSYLKDKDCYIQKKLYRRGRILMDL